MPPSAVRPIQRSMPLRLPCCIARKPITMKKLLASKTKVLAVTRATPNSSCACATMSFSLMRKMM